MELKEEIALLEEIDTAIRSEDWKENTTETIKPYNRISEIVRTINLLIDKNRLYEAKKYMDIQLENIKGITEQKCFRRKFRKDYCEHCVNQFCNLNRTQKWKLWTPNCRKTSIFPKW